MGKKAAKSTRKFAASGQLKKTIEARRKHQQIQKKLSKRRGKKNAPASHEDDDEDDENQVEKPQKKSSKAPKSVDDLLGAGFMEESDDEEAEQELVEDDDSDQEEDGEESMAEDDAASFASIDALDEEGQGHLLELSQLAEKDPEFYKYLQENDRELLEFDPNAASEPDDDMDIDEPSSSKQAPVLTKDTLQKWQRALLEKRSLRALRKLLIAFRAAVHMNDETQTLAWRIESASVYNKVLTTSLRYTPIVLEHHIPYKKLPNDKFKPPTQTQKFKTLQKLILSYFHNTIHLFSQLTDNEMLKLVVNESAKIIPYIVSSRKIIKFYLKKCLELWSTAQDDVRIAAHLAMRKLASSTDDTVLDNVLKGTYLTFVRSCKTTNAHSLPAINLMKNSGCEVFCLDQAAAYQQAFGHIRQLAIHLRNSMKIKAKDAYKQIYNWQYVHSLDFWSLVLARACGVQGGRDKVSDLKPLIYPLVQVSLGAIKLVSNVRSYPFHLHIIRSLLHLTRHTETYVPLAPYILPILTSPLTTLSRTKPSTLRPLDFELQIKVPQQYLKTKVLADGVLDESAYLLTEWLASSPVHGSIAFPEIIIPVVVTMRKAIKGSKHGGSSKELSNLKTLVERIEESARWIEQRRNKITLAPAQLQAVEDWEQHMRSNVADAPLSRYFKVQQKAREKQRKMLEKARTGENEVLED